jgi:hypothetical protein
MTLQTGLNVIFDLYPAFSPQQPYPFSSLTPIIRQGQGGLAGRVQLGRLGYQTKNLYFTHVLTVDPNNPRQDAYNTQNDPGRDNTKGGTVIIADYPIPGRCTAFYIVLVTRIAPGTPLEQVQLYLDRCQPIDKPTIDKASTIYPCLIDPSLYGCHCPSGPDAWKITLTGIGNNQCLLCGNWNTTWSLTRDTQYACANYYTHANFSPCYPSDYAMTLAYFATAGEGLPADTWRLVIDDNGYPVPGFENFSNWYTLSGTQWACYGPNTLNLLRTSNQCTGWPQTVTIYAA